MRHIFEVTMVTKQPTEDPHLNRIVFRLYGMSRVEAVNKAAELTKVINDHIKGPGYDCLFTVAGPRLDD